MTGVVEVDHCSGTRDGAAPWTADTLVMTFSVAKPFAALAFLDAVAEGHLRLDQPVTSVWPGYGRAGKERTTMRHLLSHQAGLPAFPRRRWASSTTTARHSSTFSPQPLRSTHRVPESRSMR